MNQEARAKVDLLTVDYQGEVRAREEEREARSVKEAQHRAGHAQYRRYCVFFRGGAS